MTNHSYTKLNTVGGPAIALGFGVAVAVWVVWFITHLPWLGIPERVSLPALLGVWSAGALATGYAVGRGRSLKIGAAAGLVTAAVGLLLLGTKLAGDPAVSGAAGAVEPSAPLKALAFLAMGVVIGTLGGAIGGLVSPTRARAPDTDWLSVFAWVTVAAVAPLLFIGGLVTSTNSGMAVPDWPNTFGSNMFLYPLGPRAAADVYLEHSHRLFGTLVGLAAIILAAWVLIVEQRKWVKALALVALAVVVVQGGIGGMRVLTGDPSATQDPRFLRFVHGVLAQLTFGLVVSLAVVLSPLWNAGADAEPEPGLRRLRFFSTGALHAMILQLVLGAAYRHFRDSHSLWTHAAFAVVVLIMASGAAFVAMAIAGRHGGIGPAIRKLGKATLAVVTIQFALGWVAFMAGGRALQAEGSAQALIRTVHQANGALLLALAVALFLWTRRLLRLRGPAPEPAVNGR